MARGFIGKAVDRLTGKPERSALAAIEEAARTGATGLDLSDRKLTALPPEIGQLRNLQSLDLRSNQLTTLPPEIGQLVNLQSLNLQSLNLQSNQLTTLPPEIGQLVNLQSLDLMSNQLATLPPEIGQLLSLQSLYLYGNQLSTLPPEIGQLVNLQSLNLQSNQLTTLPPEFGQLVNLKSLDLSGNPLPQPYISAIEGGIESLFTYLRTLNRAVPQYEAKLLLVGEGNVGKTSLVEAMLGHEFVENRKTTHGINLKPLGIAHPDPKISDGISLNTWDFGGQEVYRVTHQFFFSRRSLYVLVWWPREGPEAGDIEGWLQRIKLRVPDARVMIVATHADQPRHGELDYPDLKSRFGDMLCGNFAVDSESGKGVGELIEAIAREAAALPQMGEQIAPDWIAARDAALELAEKEPQITRSRFEAIAHESGISKEAPKEIDVLLDLLHDLGRIVYYGDDDGLRDTVVIKPEWLTKAIGYVLEDGPTREGSGELQHQDLKRIWHGHGREEWEIYDPQCHPFFLRLMEKFDISFRFPDRDASLVGQLVPFERPSDLPWSAPTAVPEDLRELSLICAMDQEPPGLVPWTIVRSQRFSNEFPRMHWRKGVLLSHQGQQALVELTSPTELSIRVRGDAPGHFFSLLRDGLEHLIDLRWKGLSYRLEVPCRGLTEEGKPCDRRFRLGDLTKARSRKIYKMPCVGCWNKQNVFELLTGFAAGDADISGKLDDVLTNTADASGRLRAVMKALAAENRDCPRLFTLVPLSGGPLRDTYELALWCEHPDNEHPCENGVYEIKQTKEWLANLGPYMSLTAKALKVVAAVAGLSGVVQAALGDGADKLEGMETLIGELEPPGRSMSGEMERDGGGLTRAQGAGFRELFSVLHELDPKHRWGEMRRFLTPQGDYLWICPEHHREYDPGLPILPD
ncbi:MAG: leucine-rich repeat domain-containing protein [Acidobacteria bacterium]|nr:leucine-rich repeat domain-containing protein [Acidobacteriota bacterium]